MGEQGSTAGRAGLYQQWIKEKEQDPRLCWESHPKRGTEKCGAQVKLLPASRWPYRESSA